MTSSSCYPQSSGSESTAFTYSGWATVPVETHGTSARGPTGRPGHLDCGQAVVVHRRTIRSHRLRSSSRHCCLQTASYVKKHRQSSTESSNSKSSTIMSSETSIPPTTSLRCSPTVSCVWTMPSLAFSSQSVSRLSRRMAPPLTARWRLPALSVCVARGCMVEPRATHRYSAG